MSDSCYFAAIPCHYSGSADAATFCPHHARLYAELSAELDAKLAVAAAALPDEPRTLYFPAEQAIADEYARRDAGPPRDGGNYEWQPSAQRLDGGISPAGWVDRDRTRRDSRNHWFVLGLIVLALAIVGAWYKNQPPNPACPPGQGTTICDDIEAEQRDDAGRP